MRQIRIYQPGEFQENESVKLSPEASQHVAVVLRMQVEESLILFGAHNRECEATIEEIKKKQVRVRIRAIKESNKESNLNIHLAQALSKGDRMDWVIQKSVELGVSRITPLITERCVVKLDAKRMEKKISHWQSIVISACEQCGRNTIPPIHPIVSLEHYLKSTQAVVKLILHPEAELSLSKYEIKGPELALIIGPEGGLSEAEIALSIKQGFQQASLGPRILRTETAAITALSILQAIAGDL